MTRWMRKLPAIALVAAAVGGAALTASCGDSGDSDASENAAVLNAISILDNAGLHEIDESIKNDKTIPAETQTTAQRLQTVLLLTEWPTELEDEAKALAALFGEFATAVAGDHPDMTKVAEASKKAHDGGHDFSHEVWKHLYGEAGVHTGGASAH